MEQPNILSKNNISNAYFISICNTSSSMKKAAETLNLPFSTFKNIAIKFNCYKTNQSGKGVYKAKTKMTDILSNKFNFSRCQLKKRLIRENLIEYKCVGEDCGNTGEWLGKPISLELDHINGVNNDNRIENLRFLCPNCHSQTPTFRVKKNCSLEGSRTLKNTAS